MSNTRRAKQANLDELIDGLLEDAALPERTVPICLRGDLQAEFEDLERQLAAAQRDPGDSLAGNPDVPRVAARLEGLTGQMAAATVAFTLRAMPRPEWRKFLAKHAPRDGVAEDQALGVNNDTFWDALIRRSVIDPVLTDARWAKLEPVLTSGQYDQLSETAWGLNRRDVVPPRSYAASAVMAGTGVSSKPPALGE